MSKAVAAASAMLELSTSAAENRRALRDEKVATPGVADLSRRSSHRQDAPKSPDQIKPEPPLLQVIPLSETHEHYKWSLGPSSHIISASGTHELQQVGVLALAPFLLHCYRFFRESVVLLGLVMRGRSKRTVVDNDFNNEFLVEQLAIFAVYTCSTFPFESATLGLTSFVLFRCFFCDHETLPSHRRRNSYS